MNCLLLITLFISCALALNSGANKEKRSPRNDCEDCDDPCDDCEEPRVYTKTFSPVIVQQVTDRTILVCSKESYFDRIEYDGCYDWNTTCNGVIAGSAQNVDGVYTGIIVDPHSGKETTEQLNAKTFKWITTSNNGNAQTWEEAQLDDCECDGDTLRAISNWVAVDDPLTGCCDKGVNHVEGTAYKVQIFGKCCSECYLLQASVSWNQVIKN